MLYKPTFIAKTILSDKPAKQFECIQKALLNNPPIVRVAFGFDEFEI